MIFRVQPVMSSKIRAHASRPVRVEIRRKPGLHAGQHGLMLVRGRAILCALGKAGVTSFKREGDGCTPRGTMKVLGGYVRKDRMVTHSTPSSIKAAGIQRLQSIDTSKAATHFGWCDEPSDANYNRPVRLPFKASHETMQRKDALYDLVLVLDWNISQRCRNRGSAIFWHIKPDHDCGTQGCIAISKHDFARIKSIFERPLSVVVV